MNKIRILLADDHAVLQAGLEAMLNAQGDMLVVGTAGDGHAAVRQAALLQPDVILLDINMPGINGLEALEQMRVQAPASRVLILTMHDDAQYLRQAMAGGAAGYVLKQSASTELLSALNAALKNQRYISPQLSLEVQDAIETPWVKPEGFSSKLTPRQQEVLQLLTKGFSTKEIAATMQVSTKAVEFHKGNITRRLGIRTTAELTRFALSQGLTKLDDQHP